MTPNGAGTYRFDIHIYTYAFWIKILTSHPRESGEDFTDDTLISYHVFLELLQNEGEKNDNQF